MTEWPMVELGEVVDLATGFPFKSASYSADPTHIRLLRGDNIAQGVLRWENAKRWPPSTDDLAGTYSLQVDDVVLAMDRPWIEAGLKYASITTNDLPSLLVQRVARLRGTARVTSRFLRYVIGSRSFTDHVLGVQTGTAVPHISGAQIRAYKFQLPPREVQQRIVEILGSLDDKIELNRRMNETLEAMAQAIFRDWFVDFGPTRRKLEGATDPLTIMGGLVQDTERAKALADLFPAAFGDDGLPEGWRLRKVGDVAARVAMGPFGSRITKDNFVESGVPVIRGKNLSSGFVDSDFVFLTPEKAIELGGSVARQEDIVFTHRGTLGQVGRIYPGSTFEEYVVSQSQLLLSVDRQQTGSLFLYYFFISDAGQRAWLANAGGAGVPAIASPTRSLKGIEFPDPGISIAVEFDTLTSCLEKRAIAAKHESNILAATRDLLLSKLMSGEIRLSEAEELMEAAQ